jgi:hypothetical protein
MHKHCSCGCGEKHHLNVYHHDVNTGRILWFVSRAHKDAWKEKQFGVSVVPQEQMSIPTSQYW